MSEDAGAAAYLPDTTYYNRTGAAEFMARLEREPLLMQGPMGSVLMADAGARDVPAAFWNLAEPQTVMRIHRLYEAAGAQILLAASVFHFHMIDIPELKNYLKENGILVKP